MQMKSDSSESENVSVLHPSFLETCEFSHVSDWMNKKDSHAPKWMIEAGAVVTIGDFSVKFLLHFHHDKRLTIYSSGSSGIRAGDQHAIRILAMWSISNGWSRPEPSPSEVDSAKDFWKELWITGVVDSCYLQKRFGKRRIFDEN
jgi:hypothetical protein